MAKETKIIEIRIDLFDAVERIGQLTQSIEENNAAISKLKKGDEDYQKQLGNLKTQIAAATTERRKLIASIVDEEKILKKRAAEIDRQVAAEQKRIATEQKSANAAKVAAEKREGYLNQLTISVNELEKAYYRLSKAELEGTKGASILKSLKEQRAELQNAQAAYGKYSMNVGNYASATNMLAINLGQVMKEIPNFAISARIGIMSLTNNLPMLAEAFKAVRVQQKQLVAEGKAVPSMFSLITKSVFGLTGIMSIAMVLLQLFSEDIINWVGGLFKAEGAIKSATNAQLGFNSAFEVTKKALSEGGELKQAYEEVNTLSTKLKAAKGNTELSKAALDEYNKSLGVTFGKAKNVSEALQLIEMNKDAYIEAMKNMTIANALFASSADDAVKVAEIAMKDQGQLVREAGYDYKAMFEEFQKFDAAIKKAQKEQAEGLNPRANVQIGGIFGTFYSLQGALNRRKEIVEQITKIENTERARQTEIAKKGFNEKTELAIQYYNDFAAIVKKENFKLTEDPKFKNVPLTPFEKAMNNINKDVEKFYAKMRQAIFEANKKLNKDLKKNAVDLGETAFKMFPREPKDIIERYKSINENRLKYLENVRESADYELATAELTGDKTLSLKLDLLEAERRAAVEKASQEQKDITAINEYYAAKREDIKRQEFQSALGATAELVGAIASLWEENTKEYKIFATAQAVMNTWLGVTNALSQTQGGIFAQIAGAGTALLSGLSAVRKIWDVDVNAPNVSGNASGTSSAKTKTTVTEKFHSGGVAGSTPDSPQRSEEITRTLLTTERVLSPQQTSIFDSLVAKVSAMGGSNAIVSGAAQVTSDVDRMYVAMSKALRDMPAPIMTWQEFERQQDRQRRLKNNAIIK